MPTPVSIATPRPQSLPRTVFGSASGSGKPDQFVRFGSNEVPPEPEAPSKKEPSFLKGLWEHMKGPAKIGFAHRLAALFSPTHIKNGWADARKAFSEQKRDGHTGMEVLGMLLDVALTILSVGVLLPILALLPPFNFSKTFEAFFAGIQLSKEAALNEKKSPTKGTGEA